jgi:predicted nucleotidyltransferase
MVLDMVKQFCLESLVDEDTQSVLLTGSWARGDGTDVNDIDIIIIKQFQLIDMHNYNEEKRHYTLDVWQYDKESFMKFLTTTPDDLNQIHKISLIIKGLVDSTIIYDKENFIGQYISIAQNWSWNPDSINLMNFQSEEPVKEWAKRAYLENLKYLELAKKCIETGKPISHRRKDFPKMLVNADETKVMAIMYLIQESYDLLGIEVKWPELEDAKKAINTEEWKSALASQKDVLRYILRYDLPTTPNQLLDPSIWQDTDQVNLTDSLEKTFELTYL